MHDAAHHYGLFGWTLRSARALPFLLPAPAAAPPTEPDVEIVFGPIPGPAGECIFNAQRIEVYADGSCILRASDDTFIHIADGRTLTVQGPPSLDDSILHTWLFGPAIGMLCHQRGLSPLHASAVTIGGQVVAIAGHSGAGKSTTARALVQRGHRLLTDDQAIIDPENGLLYPSFPTMKLWAQSAAALGETVDPEFRAMADRDKFHIATPEMFQEQPGHLGLVLTLATAPSLERPQATRLTTVEGAAALNRFVYRMKMGGAMGRSRDAFYWATQLAAKVPVYRLQRPENLTRLDDIADLIESLAARHAEDTAP